MNNTYGHAVGDEVIKSLAGAISGMFRKTDIQARIGGEEFAVILPDGSIDSARHRVERLRQVVEGLVLSFDNAQLSFTVSLGVAESAGDEISVEEVLDRADKALYSAKEQGRNTVCVDAL